MVFCYQNKEEDSREKRHKSKVDDLALFFRRRLLTSPSLLLNLAGD